MVRGFNHTGLVVRDLERMVRFYTADLGLHVLHELDSVAPPDGDHTGLPGARRRLVFVGRAQDHAIELIQYIHPPVADGHVDRHQLGAMHVCFDVDDLSRTWQTLKAKGVQFVTEPKFRDLEGRRIGVVYARDPEGNWLEFIEGWTRP